ncbi:MAG: hypothetical protein PVI86_09160, partial [Phycisphaerae bacterium]
MNRIRIDRSRNREQGLVTNLAVGALAVLCCTAAASAAVVTKGTLCTNTGASIFDDQLRKMLDEFIPTNSAHSTLIVLTECYGGDKLDNFAGRAGTTVLSATKAGETATYGGYDDDAASALKPEAGRDSDDVHEAGTNGKAAGETPQKQGPGASLEPTDPTDGPIKSRHVLVYAGKPDAGAGRDNDQRDTIENNFNGAAGTTVTTVGGDGTNGWDHPGTVDGLRDALKAIGQNMNSDEQFIMFVTDHGNRDKTDTTPDCTTDQCTSAPLALGLQTYAQMLADPQNDPAVSLFSPGPSQPLNVDITLNTQSFFNVPFDIALDLNDDGDMDDDGEGWVARVDVDEASLDWLFGETITVDGTNLPDIEITLESGDIAKKAVSAPIGGCVLNNECGDVTEAECTGIGGDYAGDDLLCNAIPAASSWGLVV